MNSHSARSLSGGAPPRILVPPPGPASLALAARLRRVECPDSTCLTPEFPVFWAEARGCNVLDADGNRYLDLNAGFGAAAAGHAHPEVVEAISRQAERLLHGMGDVHPHEVKTRLAEELVRRAPGGGEWRVIFGLNGSDAVEAALKTAALATGRPGVIAFDGGYHGLSIGALGASAWPKFREGFEGLAPPPAVRFPFPGLRGGDRDPALAAHAAAEVLRSIEAWLDGPEAARRPAGAILAEPILGRGGVIVPPPGFLPGLRELCGRRGVLLILDEIYTGFGRTGYWFEAEREAVVPDLLTCGKALGGGAPVSACLGRAEVMAAWGESRGEARHTSTFAGHPLGCAAALAEIEVLEQEGLIARSAEAGARFRRLLADALGDSPWVTDIRGEGMMTGIELTDPDTGGPGGAAAWRTVVEGLRRGLILLVSGPEGNVISLTPPLTFPDELMETAAELLAEALKAAGEK